MSRDASGLDLLAISSLLNSHGHHHALARRAADGPDERVLVLSDNDWGDRTEGHEGDSFPKPGRGSRSDGVAGAAEENFLCGNTPFGGYEIPRGISWMCWLAPTIGNKILCPPCTGADRNKNSGGEVLLWESLPACSSSPTRCLSIPARLTVGTRCFASRSFCRSDSSAD